MYIHSSITDNTICPNSSNKIWLERRQHFPISKRLEEYKLAGLWKRLEYCTNKQIEERLDLLDLSFLDPLTGVQGHKYYSRKSDHFLTDGILVSLREGSLEMINRELGYQYGNLLVFTLGRILESRFKHVMRTSLHGSKFLILDDDRSLFNTVHMILTRSSVRTSNGYEIKGIGIDVLSARGVKFYDKYYTLISEPDIFIFWGHSVDSRIYRIAQLSETVEWFDTYECGRFTWRIEDKILKHLLNI